MTLLLAGARIETNEPNLIETFLHIVVDPQIALLLFTLGTFGLIFELSNPSLIFPGVIGVIAIVIALFALGTLAANAAGVALLVFALLLFVSEIWVTSHGILMAGGIFALIFGALLLFPAPNPTLPGLRLRSFSTATTGNTVPRLIEHFTLNWKRCEARPEAARRNRS